jgi:hypothetical protein
MVTDPITVSSTSVKRPLSLTNVFRYRPRLSPAKGEVPLTISHGRLTDEGIIIVRLTAGVGHIRAYENPLPTGEMIRAVFNPSGSFKKNPRRVKKKNPDPNRHRSRYN